MVSGIAAPDAVRSESGPQSASEPGIAPRTADARRLAARFAAPILLLIPLATAPASDEPARRNDPTLLVIAESARLTPVRTAETTRENPDVTALMIADIARAIADLIAAHADEIRDWMLDSAEEIRDWIDDHADEIRLWIDDMALDMRL